MPSSLGLLLAELLVPRRQLLLPALGPGAAVRAVGLGGAVLPAPQDLLDLLDHAGDVGLRGGARGQVDQQALDVLDALPLHQQPLDVVFRLLQLPCGLVQLGLQVVGVLVSLAAGVPQRQDLLLLLLDGAHQVRVRLVRVRQQLLADSQLLLQIRVLIHQLPHPLHGLLDLPLLGLQPLRQPQGLLHPPPVGGGHAVDRVQEDIVVVGLETAEPDDGLVDLLLDHLVARQLLPEDRDLCLEPRQVVPAAGLRLVVLGLQQVHLLPQHLVLALVRLQVAQGLLVDAAHPVQLLVLDPQRHPGLCEIGLHPPLEGPVVHQQPVALPHLLPQLQLHLLQPDILLVGALPQEPDLLLVNVDQAVLADLQLHVVLLLQLRDLLVDPLLVGGHRVGLHVQQLVQVLLRPVLLAQQLRLQPVQPVLQSLVLLEERNVLLREVLLVLRQELEPPGLVVLGHPGPRESRHHLLRILVVVLQLLLHELPLLLGEVVVAQQLVVPGALLAQHLHLLPALLEFQLHALPVVLEVQHVPAFVVVLRAQQPAAVLQLGVQGALLVGGDGQLLPELVDLPLQEVRLLLVRVDQLPHVHQQPLREGQFPVGDVSQPQVRGLWDLPRQHVPHRAQRLVDQRDLVLCLRCLGLRVPELSQKPLLLEVLLGPELGPLNLHELVPPAELRLQELDLLLLHRQLVPVHTLQGLQLHCVDVGPGPAVELVLLLGVVTVRVPDASVPEQPQLLCREDSLGDLRGFVRTLYSLSSLSMSVFIQITIHTAVSIQRSFNNIQTIPTKKIYNKIKDINQRSRSAEILAYLIFTSSSTIF